jgi:hypothetical protein
MSEGRFGIKRFVPVLAIAACAFAQDFVTVRDSREQAFSLDVPAGWTVHGGMFRLNAMDPRPVVDMTSPDGKSSIRIGDIVPAYRLPTLMLARMGFTEGKIFPVNSSFPVVARFRPATEYIGKYGMSRFGSMCQAVELKQSNAVEPRINKTQIPGGQNTAAEAYFTCTSSGQPMLGYVYGETYATAPGPGGLWGVGAIGSFLAPAAQSKAVGALLTQSWKTWAFNPQWSQMQGAVAAGIARGSTRALQGMSHSMDNLQDILTGTAYTRDTVSGAFREVPAGNGGQMWISGNNVVAESAFQPGPGFHQIQTVGR